MMKEDEEDEDAIEMDMQDEKELQAVEAPELKPEKMENQSKASQRGTLYRRALGRCNIANKKVLNKPEHV